LCLVAYVAILPASIGVTVRRLHDTGKSGWFYWLTCLPTVGAILLFIWAIEASDGPNQWGNPT